jgi:diguanylate cyclase (GGDEF)-like protein
LLTSSCRKSDIVGRLGGDEFIMVLWDCDIRQCNEFLNRFAKRCKVSPLPNMDVPIFVTASFGVCRVTNNLELDALLLCADKNLYSAKSSEEVCCGSEETVESTKDGKANTEFGVTNNAN